MVSTARVVLGTQLFICVRTREHILKSTDSEGWKCVFEDHLTLSKKEESENMDSLGSALTTNLLNDLGKLQADTI